MLLSSLIEHQPDLGRSAIGQYATSLILHESRSDPKTPHSGGLIENWVPVDY
jgi:hypothetical protein